MSIPVITADQAASYIKNKYDCYKGYSEESIREVCHMWCEVIEEAQNDVKKEYEEKNRFMRYLITTKEVKSPFLTQWFEPENHFNEDVEMIVYDLVECKFTTDGKIWHDIEIDHL